MKLVGQNFNSDLIILIWIILNILNIFGKLSQSHNVWYKNTNMINEISAAFTTMTSGKCVIHGVICPLQTAEFAPPCKLFICNFVCLFLS